jgi:hypothetical protein
MKLTAFAEFLNQEHRQYHVDVLSGINTGTIIFRAHSRKIRDSKRKGEYTLCVIARLTKMMRDSSQEKRRQVYYHFYILLGRDRQGIVATLWGEMGWSAIAIHLNY